MLLLHDLHATLFHLLGIDHERLIYRYRGRRNRLTDVRDKLVRAIMLDARAVTRKPSLPGARLAPSRSGALTSRQPKGESHACMADDGPGLRARRLRRDH